MDPSKRPLAGREYQTTLRENGRAYSRFYVAAGLLTAGAAYLAWIQLRQSNAVKGTRVPTVPRGDEPGLDKKRFPEGPTLQAPKQVQAPGDVEGRHNALKPGMMGGSKTITRENS